MSDDRERRRAVLWLWFAGALGVGALGLLVLDYSFFSVGPGFFCLGVIAGATALAIGVAARRRVRKLREARGERGSGRDSAVAMFGGFVLGCAVFVGVLALLMSVLPPHVWFREHHGAHKAVCLSNVKNLALAVQMYLADNGDVFPAADSWCESLGDYIKNWDVLQCPSAREAGRECDFAFNRSLDGANLSDVADPATTVAIFESDIGWNAAGDARNLPVAPRHLGGDNYALANGSARWVKREDLALGRAEIGWSVGRGKERNVSDKYTCPCCGYKTLAEQPPGTFEICDICGWEDENVQFYDPDYRGGANDVSLREAQRNFEAFGASDRPSLAHVRKPTSEDVRDPNWRPLP